MILYYILTFTNIYHILPYNIFLYLKTNMYYELHIIIISYNIPIWICPRPFINLLLILIITLIQSYYKYNHCIKYYN